MTHLFPCDAKPTLNFMLFKPKQTVRVDDVILFQFPDPTADNGDEERPVEYSVVVNYASTPDEPGLYSKFQLIGWNHKP